jgi:hypothetical protein
MAAVSLFFFTACTSSVPVVPKSPSFQQGESDGCATANGTYTKDSEAFRNDNAYKEGWFSGRSQCNPSHSRK